MDGQSVAFSFVRNIGKERNPSYSMRYLQIDLRLTGYSSLIQNSRRSFERTGKG